MAGGLRQSAGIVIVRRIRRRALGLLVASLGALGACVQDLCYEPVPRLQLPGTPTGVFAPDGRRAYFLVYAVYERHARGICRFPDGGGSITAHEFADYFELDVEQRTLRHLASFPGGPDFALSGFTGSFGLSHAGSGRVYGYAVGAPRGALTPASREELDALTRRRYFELDMERGEAVEIDLSGYEQGTRSLPRADEAMTDARGYRVLLHQELARQGSAEAFSFELHAPAASDTPPETLITGLDWLPHGIDYYLWGPDRLR
jgi:hypothetical protein